MLIQNSSTICVTHSAVIQHCQHSFYIKICCTEHETRKNQTTQILRIGLCSRIPGSSTLCGLSELCSERRSWIYSHIREILSQVLLLCGDIDHQNFSQTEEVESVKANFRDPLTWQVVDRSINILREQLSLLLLLCSQLCSLLAYFGHLLYTVLFFIDVSGE